MESKVAYRNTLVPCKVCGVEVRRRDMDKHRLSTHGIGDVQLTSKVATRLKEKGLCHSCGKQKVEVWLFRKTSRGPVQLCSLCRSACIEQAFGPQTAEGKRLAGLKAELAEIQGMLANPVYATIHARLKEQVPQLQAAIRRPSIGGHSWSPVLPGSYGAGRRR